MTDGPDLTEWAESLSEDELAFWVTASMGIQLGAAQGISPQFYLKPADRMALTDEQREHVFGDSGAGHRHAAFERYARENGGRPS